MINILEEAERLAKSYHKGQEDLMGEDYINHVSMVVNIVKDHTIRYIDRDEYVQAAWLHDILEDTKLSSRGLLNKGFNERVVEAVEQVTNEGCSSYEEYINKIESDIARVVKMADLKHNMDVTRLGKENYGELTKGQKKRVNKYAIAFIGLSKGVEESEEIGKIYNKYRGK